MEGEDENQQDQQPGEEENENIASASNNISKFNMTKVLDLMKLNAEDNMKRVVNESWSVDYLNHLGEQFNKINEEKDAYIKKLSKEKVQLTNRKQTEIEQDKELQMQLNTLDNFFRNFTLEFDNMKKMANLCSSRLKNCKNEIENLNKILNEKVEERNALKQKYFDMLAKREPVEENISKLIKMKDQLENDEEIQKQSERLLKNQKYYVELKSKWEFNLKLFEDEKLEVQELKDKLKENQENYELETQNQELEILNYKKEIEELQKYEKDQTIPKLEAILKEKKQKNEEQDMAKKQSQIKMDTLQNEKKIKEKEREVMLKEDLDLKLNYELEQKSLQEKIAANKQNLNEMEIIYNNLKENRDVLKQKVELSQMEIDNLSTNRSVELIKNVQISVEKQRLEMQVDEHLFNEQSFVIREQIEYTKEQMNENFNRNVNIHSEIENVTKASDDLEEKVKSLNEASMNINKGQEEKIDELQEEINKIKMHLTKLGNEKKLVKESKGKDFEELNREYEQEMRELKMQRSARYNEIEVKWKTQEAKLTTDLINLRAQINTSDLELKEEEIRKATLQINLGEKLKELMHLRKESEFNKYKECKKVMEKFHDSSIWTENSLDADLKLATKPKLIFAQKRSIETEMKPLEETLDDVPLKMRKEDLNVSSSSSIMFVQMFQKPEQNNPKKPKY